jgi:cytochrome c
MPDLSSRLFFCSFLRTSVRVITFCSLLLGCQVSVFAQPNTSKMSVQSVSQADLDKGLALAKSKTCLGCHQIDAKRVGPAFQQIAQRHADTPGDLDYLVGAIRQGGRGRWGAVPMPAQPQVSESESRLLAQWILSLKP